MTHNIQLKTLQLEKNTLIHEQRSHNKVIEESKIKKQRISKVDEFSDIIGNPVKIGRIEIAEKDFPKWMDWWEAKESCESLGEGWRLPTDKELNLIYINKENIGGLYYLSCPYWGSNAGKASMGTGHNAFNKQVGGNGNEGYSSSNYPMGCARAVRDL